MDGSPGPVRPTGQARPPGLYAPPAPRRRRWPVALAAACLLATAAVGFVLGLMAFGGWFGERSAGSPGKGADPAVAASPAPSQGGQSGSPRAAPTPSRSYSFPVFQLTPRSGGTQSGAPSLGELGRVIGELAADPGATPPESLPARPESP